MNEPLILPILTFYLPKLLNLHGKEFSVWIVLNKCDLKAVVKKQDVVPFVKSFPNVNVTSTGRGMKKSLNSLFRGVMRGLLVEKEDGCILLG